MEVIQWTALWDTFKDEFENERNMLGGSLGEKAAEDLKLRVIEHVMPLKHSLNDIWLSFVVSLMVLLLCCFYIKNMYIILAEHPCCIKILLTDNLEEACRSTMSHSSGQPADII